VEAILDVRGCEGIKALKAVSNIILRFNYLRPE
jgi:hypothetical protein